MLACIVMNFSASCTVIHSCCFYISEIYSKVAKNAVVEAEPSVLHFGGFELGVTQTQVINLINVSAEVQKMHVIPPQTKYFYIKYKKAVSVDFRFGHFVALCGSHKC